MTTYDRPFSVQWLLQDLIDDTLGAAFFATAFAVPDAPLPPPRHSVAARPCMEEDAVHTPAASGGPDAWAPSDAGDSGTWAAAAQVPATASAKSEPLSRRPGSSHTPSSIPTFQ
jgi:hypothetical protein